MFGKLLEIFNSRTSREDSFPYQQKIFDLFHDFFLFYHKSQYQVIDLHKHEKIKRKYIFVSAFDQTF